MHISLDQGRYAYLNQPAILIWNLAKFAETLIPLIGENEEKSIKQLSDILQVTMPTYQEYFYEEMRQKLGLIFVAFPHRNILDT